MTCIVLTPQPRLTAASYSLLGGIIDYAFPNGKHFFAFSEICRGGAPPSLREAYLPVCAKGSPVLLGNETVQGVGQSVLITGVGHQVRGSL